MLGFFGGIAMSEPSQRPVEIEADPTPAAGASEVPNPMAEKDSTPSVEEMLRQAELNAQEHHDAWLRAKAETENVRRRALEDVEKARKFALDKFAGDLLAVKDSLEAALGTGDSASVESLKSGVELTLKQLVSVFEKNNVKEINPMGEKLDPNYHQAIGMVDGAGEANTVAQVLQKGYALNERILRPALVMVTKPKA
jgi:molecular chaperone GrpE